MKEITVKFGGDRLFFTIGKETYFIDLNVVLPMLITERIHSKIRKLINKLNLNSGGK